jgi:Arc/MetJ-type ribon-helix-helix transcriptional regulator
MAKGHVVKVFRVKMSEAMVQDMDDLINNGNYVTYADLLRHAIDLLMEENTLKKFKEAQMMSSIIPTEESLSEKKEKPSLTH